MNDGGEVKPRSLRFTWSMKTTSSRDPNEIMAEIKKVKNLNFLACARKLIQINFTGFGRQQLRLRAKRTFPFTVRAWWPQHRFSSSMGNRSLQIATPIFERGQIQKDIRYLDWFQRDCVQNSQWAQALDTFTFSAKTTNYIHTHQRNKNKLRKRKLKCLDLDDPETRFMEAIST